MLLLKLYFHVEDIHLRCIFAFRIPEQRFLCQSLRAGSFSLKYWCTQRSTHSVMHSMSGKRVDVHITCCQKHYLSFFSCGGFGHLKKCITYWRRNTPFPVTQHAAHTLLPWVWTVDCEKNWTNSLRCHPQVLGHVPKGRSGQVWKRAGTRPPWFSHRRLAVLVWLVKLMPTCAGK